MNIIKRNGTIVPYDNHKIKIALQKANNSVKQIEQISEQQIDNLINTIENQLSVAAIEKIAVEELQDAIELELMKLHKFTLAKNYITYRYNRTMVREQNTTDESILGLIKHSNKTLMEENSNKNAILTSTQRDLIAGEVSKDLTKRILLPKHIVEAHENGAIHFHDMDYFLQPMFNCCLVNIKDILENGTVMNGKLIETPKSFQVACTVMTQVVAAVASSQYGGQSVAVKHLGHFLAKSEEKFRQEVQYTGLTKEQEDKLVARRLKAELSSGVQTIQYQVNTLMTTNGQSPFLTLFLELDKNDPYLDYTAMIIEEILEQRLKGIKNEVGVYITPAFPKLVYVLDEHNNLTGGKYDYITRLAARCSAKRMYPDYISAKKMREIYQGNIFSPMGCRSYLSPWKDESGNYQFEGRFNQGVVSLNLPQIAIAAKGDFDKFWSLLDERCELAKEALLCRHKSLLGTKAEVSPIHWMYGAIARLDKNQTIDHLLKGGYSTLSLGYIGVYEMSLLMTGESNTSEKGKQFALEVLQYMRAKCDAWKKDSGLGYALYGTPSESLCYRFASIDQAKYGTIPNVTDKGYYTNSYHVDVREHIDAFSKFAYESEFQAISSGGAISYIEIPNMQHNIAALEEVIKYMYDNIFYAEFNTKSDYCHECGFDGEIKINDAGEWECPNCGNKNKKRMNVVRRTCGLTI